jgi:hypothetical protein
MSRQYPQLGGDRNAHTIISKHKHGHSARKIAKHMGLPLSHVKEIIAKVDKT